MTAGMLCTAELKEIQPVKPFDPHLKKVITLLCFVCAIGLPRGRHRRRTDYDVTRHANALVSVDATTNKHISPQLYLSFWLTSVHIPS